RQPCEGRRAIARIAWRTGQPGRNGRVPGSIRRGLHPRRIGGRLVTDGAHRLPPARCALSLFLPACEQLAMVDEPRAEAPAIALANRAFRTLSRVFPR